MDSDDQYQEGAFKRADLCVPNVKGFESQLGHVSPVMTLGRPVSIHHLLYISISWTLLQALHVVTLLGTQTVLSIHFSDHSQSTSLSIPPSICSGPATDSADQDYK